MTTGRTTQALTTTTHRLVRPPSLVLLQRGISGNSNSNRPAASSTTRATRRDTLFLGAATGLTLLTAETRPQAALAAEAEAEAEVVATSSSSATTTTYTDAADGFALSIPKGWSTGEGSLSGNASFSGSTGSRRAVAFFDPSDAETNVVVVVGNTSPEFTKMSSFGTPTTWSSALVNSMDRGFLLRAPAWVRAREAGPGGAVQVARLLDAKEVGIAGADGDGKGYLTDYTIAQVFPDGVGEGAQSAPKRRLVSVAALHTTPKGYRRIVTVTAQTTGATDGDKDARVAALRTIVESLRIV
jgi:hypothetical protein